MPAVIYCGSMGDWPFLTDELPMDRSNGVLFHKLGTGFAIAWREFVRALSRNTQFERCG